MYPFARPTVRLAALLALLILPPAATLAQDDPRAFMLASSCAACHGTDGNSPGAIPTLNGKSRRFIEIALKDYRSGDSEGTVMNRLARGYSDEEIELIAAYYAGKAGEEE